MSFNWSVSFRLPHQYPLCISLLAHLVFYLITTITASLTKEHYIRHYINSDTTVISAVTYTVISAVTYTLISGAATLHPNVLFGHYCELHIFLC